jgi:hypothetical protein
MRRDLPLVALLIDYDNLEIGASYDLPGRPLDLGCVIELAQRYGTVIVARAYADWSDPAERLAVYESGIEPCYAPVFRTSPGEPGKSLADTVLVADGVDILWRVAPDYLVLVTSDKDILPLARLARLRGTKTIVVGSERTAQALRRLADEYISYRDLVRGTGVPVAPHQRAGLVPLSRGPLSASASEQRSGPRLVAEARPAPELRRTAEPRASNGMAAAAPTTEPERLASEPSTSSRRRRRRRRGSGLAAATPTPAEQSAAAAEMPAGEARDAASGAPEPVPAEPGDAVAVPAPEPVLAASPPDLAAAGAEPVRPLVPPPPVVQRAPHGFGSFEPPSPPPASPPAPSEPALDRAPAPSLEATGSAEPAREPEAPREEPTAPTGDGVSQAEVAAAAVPVAAGPPRRRRRAVPRGRTPAPEPATTASEGPASSP